MDHDVFISYRRDGGSQSARLVKLAIEQQGWRCFLDVDALGAEHFDERLLHEIEVASRFVVILFPGALDRCNDPNDWLRREISHALALRAAAPEGQRLVVPVTFDRFTFPPKEQLPPDLHELPRHNAIAWSHLYHAASVEKLLRFLRLEARRGAVPTSAVAPAPAITGSTLEDLPRVAEVRTEGHVVAWTIAPAFLGIDPHYDQMIDRDSTGFGHPSGQYFIIQNHTDETLDCRLQLVTRGRVVRVAQPTEVPGLTVRVPRLPLGRRSRCGVAMDGLPPRSEVVLAGGNVGPQGSAPADEIAELSCETAGVRILNLQDEIQRAASRSRTRACLLDLLDHSRSWLLQAALCVGLAEPRLGDAEELVERIARLPGTEDYPRLTALTVLRAARSARFAEALPVVAGRLKRRESRNALLRLFRAGADSAELEAIHRTIEASSGDVELVSTLLRLAFRDGERAAVYDAIIRPMLVGRPPEHASLAPLARQTASRGAYGEATVAGLEQTAVQPDARDDRDDLTTHLLAHLVRATPNSIQADTQLASRARAVLGGAFDAAALAAVRAAHRPREALALLATVPPATLESPPWRALLTDRLRSATPAELRLLVHAVARLPAEEARQSLEAAYDPARFSTDVGAHSEYLRAMRRAGARLPMSAYEALAHHPNRGVAALATAVGVRGGDAATLLATAIDQARAGAAPTVAGALKKHLDVHPDEVPDIEASLTAEILQAEPDAQVKLLSLISALPIASQVALGITLADRGAAPLRERLAHRYVAARQPETFDLVERLRADPVARVRAAVARALPRWLKTRGPLRAQAVEMTRALLEDDDESVTRGALRSLCAVGSPEAVRPLTELTQREDPAAARAAAECLMHLHAHVSTPTFRPHVPRWLDQVIQHGDADTIASVGRLIELTAARPSFAVLEAVIETGGPRGEAARKIAEHVELQR